MGNSEIHNFSPGGSIFPPEVSQMTAEAILNWNHSGQSILSTSSSSVEFQPVISKLKLLVRELLEVPGSYSILFLNGGANSLYHRIPQSFLKTKAAYLDSGYFANQAVQAAQHYGPVEAVASSADRNYSYIPDIPDESLQGDYLHTCSNNGMEGTQIFDFRHLGIPHICDMSSDLFSRIVPIRDFDLIYADAQYNLSMEGMTLLIARKSFLDSIDRQLPSTSDSCNLQYADQHLNLPPMLCLYTAMLNLIWLKDQGGVAAIERRNIKKSRLLYEEIDRNPLFYGDAAVAHRSRMTVSFKMTTPEGTAEFQTYASNRGIVGISRDAAGGGFLAQLSNALSLVSIQALIQTMQDYHKSTISL